MKKILNIGMMLLICSLAMAQSQYISYREYIDKDRKADLLGASGILIYSQQGDLIITLTNVKKPIIQKNGKGEDGLYEYEIIIEPDETRQPKLEITKRGGVDRQSFIAKIKPDFYKAYIIEEVPNPIRLEDQTRSQDVILDAKYAAVEIESAIESLKIVYSDSLHAQVTTVPKESDNTVFVTTLKIPIDRLKDVENRLAEADRMRDELYNKLTNPGVKLSVDDEKKYDDLDKEIVPALESVLQQMNQIEVYAEGTNHLGIDITGIGPREKRRYGILLLKVTIHATEYGDMMTEAARLLKTRNYDEAKATFQNALNAKDRPEEMIPVIQSNIAECDSCILYDRYAKFAILKMKEMRQAGSATQDHVKEYASAALDFLKTLNNYNPSDFYMSRIQKLEQMIENMPLVIKFTVNEWIRDVSGFHIGGGIGRVELWANFGFSHPDLKDYNREKRFRKMIESSSLYQKIGETDPNGVIIVNLDRKSLPKGLFFHALEELDIKVEYVPMQKIMRDSKNDYKMRQYRIRMCKNE